MPNNLNKALFFLDEDDGNNVLNCFDKETKLFVDLSQGMNPKDLTEKERVMLKKRFGKNVLCRFNQ